MISLQARLDPKASDRCEAALAGVSAAVGCCPGSPCRGLCAHIQPCDVHKHDMRLCLFLVVLLRARGRDGTGRRDKKSAAVSSSWMLVPARRCGLNEGIPSKLQDLGVKVWIVRRKKLAKA